MRQHFWVSNNVIFQDLHGKIEKDQKEQLTYGWLDLDDLYMSTLFEIQKDIESDHFD